MSDDLTLLYYTANVIPDHVGERVREHLQGHELPTVCVSQEPLEEFADEHVYVGRIGASIFNCYQQILLGAYKVATEFVACCEDDTLYPHGYFERRPTGNCFSYIWKWLLNDDGRFIFRRRVAMSTCICPRALLIQTLEERFERYPEPPLEREGYRHWGEPGRYETQLGLQPVPMEIQETEPRPVVFNHRPSLGGKRRILSGDQIVTEAWPWGNGSALWHSYWTNGQ